MAKLVKFINKLFETVDGNGDEYFALQKVYYMNRMM